MIKKTNGNQGRVKSREKREGSGGAGTGKLRVGTETERVRKKACQDHRHKGALIGEES